MSSRATSGSNGGEMVTIQYPETDPQLRHSYFGNVLRQKPHGYGVLRWRRGNYVRFEGLFRHGTMKEGTLYFGPKGRSTYSGQLMRCRAEGRGELEPDEQDDTLLQFYTGDWENGLKSGWGLAQYRNGDVYEGDWRGNKMCGQGQYQWADGTVFRGTFSDDAIHGPGVCQWRNQRQLHLEFSHSYPTNLRSAVRVLCVILVVLTLLYVLPHVVDMAIPVDESVGADGSGVGGGGAGAGAGATAGDGWSKSGHDDVGSTSSALSSALFPFGNVWMWLWPWSDQQERARAISRQEAATLSAVGLRGVRIQGLWNAFSGTSSAATLPALVPFNGSSVIVHPPTSFLPPGHVLLDDGSDGPFETAPGPDPLGDGVRLDGGQRRPRGVSAFATLDAVAARHGVALTPAFATAWNVSQSSDAASRAGSWDMFAVGTDPPPDANADSDADDPSAGQGSTLFTVLTLYLRLHLKRQLHYLRLGMVLLFALTGDLEDAMAAIAWPLLCAVCRSGPADGSGFCPLSDRAVFWMGLLFATGALFVFSVVTVIILPEALSDVLQNMTMDSVTPV